MHTNVLLQRNLFWELILNEKFSASQQNPAIQCPFAKVWRSIWLNCWQIGRQHFLENAQFSPDHNILFSKLRTLSLFMKKSPMAGFCTMGRLGRRPGGCSRPSTSSRPLPPNPTSAVSGKPVLELDLHRPNNNHSAAYNIVILPLVIWRPSLPNPNLR